MRPTLLIPLLAMLTIPAPATADISARYKAPDGRVLLIEAADDGSGRLTPEGPGAGVAETGYAVFIGDDSWLVFDEEGRNRVMRMADFEAAIEAALAQMLAALDAGPAIGAVANLAGEAIDSESQAPPVTEHVERFFVPAGKATVGGRTGTLHLENGSQDETRGLVIGDDPALAPIGRIFGKAIVEMPGLSGLMGGDMPGWELELGALLERGAPLRVGDFALETVSNDKIAPGRFVLPGPPISREEFQQFVTRRGEGSAGSADGAVTTDSPNALRD